MRSMVEGVCAAAAVQNEAVTVRVCFPPWSAAATPSTTLRAVPPPPPGEDLSYAAITCAANRSISSYCGLICSSSRSTPAAS
jgi:hypothetical protein